MIAKNQFYVCFKLLLSFSKLTVITRHSSKDFGSKLEFDYDGKLTAKTPCARETGTTMIINQLFHTLPVRHKEFQRNVKKEFPKLNSVLQAYGIINTGVRLSCTNTTDKNKKNVLLSTPGSDNFIENIASIFGPKQVCLMFGYFDQATFANFATNSKKQKSAVLIVILYSECFWQENYLGYDS